VGEEFSRQGGGWLGMSSRVDRVETHAGWRPGTSRVETQDQNKVCC